MGPAAERTVVSSTTGADGTSLAPVRPDDRVLALDLARGVALFGILVVNIELFRGPGVFEALAGEEQAGVDAALGGFVAWLFETKFVSQFSFAFGLGLALQARSAERAGRSSRRLLLRRLGVLAVLGLLHATLLWSGDILVTYAVVGLVLLPLRASPPHTCLWWAVGLLAVPALLVVAGGLLLAATGAAADPALVAAQEPYAALAEQLRAGYTSGSYSGMLRARLTEWRTVLPFALASSPLVAGMALLGMATARAGVLDDLERHGPLLRRVATIGLAVGLPLSALYAVAGVLDPAATSGAGIAAQGLVFVATPVLALGYAATLARVALARPGARVVRQLAAVGRMALSNYLLQSVLCTAVFYGGGLYGRVGPVPALAVAVAVYAVNVAVSAWWLPRHRQGPVEALWRRLTYAAAAGR